MNWDTVIRSFQVLSRELIIPLVLERVSKEQTATRGSEGRVIKKKFQYFMEMRDSSLLAPDGCFMHCDCNVLEFGRNNLIQVPY